MREPHHTLTKPSNATAGALARLAAAALPAVFVIVSSESPFMRGVASIVTAYAGLRLVVRSQTTAMVLADAMVASIALALTGGQSSALLPFGVAAAATAGIAAGAGAGAIAGVVVVAASVPLIAHEAGAGIGQLNQAASWAALFPLSGVAGGFVRALWLVPAADRGQERREIARDLHDGVAQTLAHLRLELDMIARTDLFPASDPDEIARLARLAERTLEDVRLMISDLGDPQAVRGSRAALVPDLVPGLGATLRAYCADLETGHGPQIRLEVTGEIPPSPKRDANLFRIAQEAVSNAVRHAQPSSVTVSVRAGARIDMTIDDDGIGMMPPGARRDGIGLTTMRERAAALGGVCRISPRPGGGTRVHIEVPNEMERTA